MNLSSAAFAIALSAAASTATVSAYSFSAKSSKASSKATKAKSTKTKASKGSYSYSMSISLPNCKRAEEPYDTGSGEITFDVNELLTPEAGETFTFFDYSSASANYECSGDDTGIMTFSADGGLNPDGTIAECFYAACYDEECAPECCCDNSIIFKVDD